MFQLQPYASPPWASGLGLIPAQRCRLAVLPTPIHRWAVPGVPPGCELHIKRDDLTGMQLSGNKVRSGWLLHRLLLLAAAGQALGGERGAGVGNQGRPCTSFPLLSLLPLDRSASSSS